MSVLVELLFRIPEADYLLSSAMVKNGEEIRKWIESASEHQCILLDNAWKPTSQLQGCIVYSTTEESELRQKINAFKRSGITSQSKHMKMHLWMTPYCLFSLKSIWDSLYVDDYYFTQILNRKVQLKLNDRYALTPNCNEVAAEIASKFSMNRKKVIIFVLQPNYANSICNRLDSIYKRYGYTIQDINWNVYQDKVSAIEAELGGWEYSYLSKCTVATPHHALLLDYERAISEDLFVNSSLIDVMVATPTISQGVNLPSDIVVIAGSARFNPDKEEREQIKAHDLLNAVGRAGRAGYRSHGAAILIPSSIIVYENYKIHENWMKLREEIFSQGDRCLEIEDPLSFIFNGEVTNDSNPIILKIQGNESELEKKFKKTFFYYQHSKSNIELRSIAKNLIAVRKNDSKNIDWCSELAIQLGLKESYIYLIDKTIDKDILNNSESLSIFNMIKLIRHLFIKIPQIIYGTLLLALSESELQQLLGIKNMNGFSTEEE